MTSLHYFGEQGRTNGEQGVLLTGASGSMGTRRCFELLQTGVTIRIVRC
jgi:NADP-dependent 3-hydroxy acid dehydrogenase YdfG